MDMQVFHIESNRIIPQKGRILISSPFIMDYNFSRSVILIVQHSNEGSMGIIINKNFKYDITLNDIFPNSVAKAKIPLFRGGPIEKDSLFYVHKLGFVNGALPLGNGVYINGDLSDIIDYINSDNYKENTIKFFCGYAGWKTEQLEKEINENSWIVSTCNDDLLFFDDLKDIWNTSLNLLGGKYSIWAKYPKFPILN